MDLFIQADPANAKAIYAALAKFGTPLQGIRTACHRRRELNCDRTNGLFLPQFAIYRDSGGAKHMVRQKRNIARNSNLSRVDRFLVSQRCRKPTLEVGAVRPACFVPVLDHWRIRHETSSLRCKRLGCRGQQATLNKHGRPAVVGVLLVVIGPADHVAVMPFTGADLDAEG